MLAFFLVCNIINYFFFFFICSFRTVSFPLVVLTARFLSSLGVLCL